MPNLKRSAPDSLLPTRAPKIARTSRTYFGQDPSPSQQEGILCRWQRLWNEAIGLGRDTLAYLVYGTMPGVLAYAVVVFADVGS